MHPFIAQSPFIKKLGTLLDQVMGYSSTSTPVRYVNASDRQTLDFFGGLSGSTIRLQQIEICYTGTEY
jgi:hypothetical protein